MKIPVAPSISMIILQIWKPRRTRENNGMQAKELLYAWGLPCGKLGKKWVFQLILEFTLKTAPNRKHFERQRETMASKERESHLWFPVLNGTTHLSMCRMTNSLPQQQEVLSHNFSAVEQNWALGDTGQGRRTKSHRRKGREKKWPGGQLQFNIC